MAEPKITRPSQAPVRREEISAHWVVGGMASITVGTHNIRVPAGQQKTVDLGGLEIVIRAKEDVL